MQPTITLCLPILILLNTICQATPTTTPDSAKHEKSLFEALTRIRKQHNLLEIKLNTRMAFHSDLSPQESEQSAFRMDYLRLQITGNITERIFYKWMQHLNKSDTPHSLDNMPASINCLGVGFHITPALSLFAGKQYADFGGFEYDADPAEVYSFSDFGNNITCFLMGVHLAWWVTPSQEIRFQITDARSNKDDKTQLPANYKTAKTPLGYTVNWNGNFLDNTLSTRCSFSLFHESQKQNIYFWALAGAWQHGNFNMYIDGLFSIEEIDKLGILSEISGQAEQPYRATHCQYFSLISRLNYRILSKLNIFAKGTYETASARTGTNLPESGKYRTSYGYQGGIEYFPMKENLRFFLVYRGKQTDYTRLSAPFHLSNEHPQHLSLGLTYKIPIY
ncbi:MAG: porin [Odoribacter sp.]|nr:porin [Odoribacter sp.]